ncbi:MAG: glycosyltransferase family 9 protein [Gemmatimonadota bacterium]|nr:glycosyltransferase family 9 protein [Gemmatimonadota bacterium]MDH5759323.1 glycosyltransferase family 9 protein [Gemmatimonadota bacterium]
MTRGPGSPPRDVCVVMLSAVGDAVHVLPVVTALKRAWPETRITWIVQPAAHSLVRHHPDVDEFIVFDRERGLRGWRGFQALAHRLRDRRFDLVLALQVYLKAGLITHLVSADRKLGFDLRRAGDLQWLFTTERIAAHPPQHVQDQYFEFLDHLGVSPEPVEWRLGLTEGERADQARFFGSLDGPACAVVLGTSRPEKNWHTRGYVQVVEELARTHGLRPVLVGGPSPLERRMADEILAGTTVDVVDMLGDGLRRLLWLLDGCVLTVSPDTGPLHISRAVGTPVVGLYGHTNPKRYGPYRAFQDLVVDGYARHPGEECPPERTFRDGMNRVTVERVLEKISLAMERYVRP